MATSRRNVRSKNDSSKDGDIVDESPSQNTKLDKNFVNKKSVFNVGPFILTILILLGVGYWIQMSGLDLVSDVDEVVPSLKDILPDSITNNKKNEAEIREPKINVIAKGEEVKDKILDKVKEQITNTEQKREWGTLTVLKKGTKEFIKSKV